MWILVSVVVIVVISGVIPLIHLKQRSELLKTFKNGSELLVVFAHPDDETMFFLPLLVLARRLGVRYRFLCLTTGDYDGLGVLRSKEFEEVGRHLQAVKADIVDNPLLRDGPGMWDPEDVKAVVEAYLSKTPSVKALFTFDDYGVSGHPNHISVYRGVRLMNSRIARYSLESVPIWRKYLPPLDVLLTYLFSTSTSLIAVNVDEPLLSMGTMRIYESQNVWFRKLFSVFSRYSYINTFKRIV
jgi:N-acetylglucosaminylphosphatidylinositol deacetylase